MKYMHFNSSCSYTALAMLLEEKGINTEDKDIAMTIGLPWIFVKEDGCFMAGPDLQGAEWFDIYLNPRGLRMFEEYVDRESIPDYLVKHGNCMLGIRLPENKGKHAVVFYKFDGSYHFYNPVREGSEENTEIVFGKEELLRSADQKTIVGRLEACTKTGHDMQTILEKSVSVLRENLKAIDDFCRAVHEPDEYKETMDSVFRSIFLDGISMLEIAGEKDLAAGFRKLQSEYLQFLRSDMLGVLADHFSLDTFRILVEEYIKLIEKQNRMTEHGQ